MDIIKIIDNEQAFFELEICHKDGDPIRTEGVLFSYEVEYDIQGNEIFVDIWVGNLQWNNATCFIHYKFLEWIDLDTLKSDVLDALEYKGDIRVTNPKLAIEEGRQEYKAKQAGVD